MEATHKLENQGQTSSAGSKFSSPQITHSLESQGQVLSAGSKASSPPKPLTSWRAKDMGCQQGSKASSPQKPLTNWRAKDRCHQQGPNPAHHRSHSLPGEPRTGVVSSIQMQFTTEATHRLESQGQVSSAESKSNSALKPLTPWRGKDRHH